MQDKEKDILITVPEFKKNEDLVQYRVQFQNQKSLQTFENHYRYSELKRFHETLETLKVDLPAFPGSYWWKSVNSNIQLIQQRQQLLDSYFKNLTQIKLVRESLIYKNFILVALKESDKKAQKENKEKAKISENKVKRKRKLEQFGQFITPMPNPVNLPPTPEDRKERSQSVEHKPVNSMQRNERKKTSKQQSPVLNFGGSKIFRGILSNAAKQ
ncbi:unnamed protein product (macronuclear) [Paramecium tetraurelia]|uniref:PX domain-containing protein n=1 Tax=Paramecium tetraurelia TaxID=5888 RepID=A0E994_PARTE|nr:uncharacterized protein GSPATT00024592001 [Paramecium tetraurelia]CAK91861.1 unnamed protein product [Paramecium tetraurelia]|eukprot:XP_001459258.1 hypothetical protein (macronuclear) [Paramecium tetraurelia strain d4-2]